MYTFVAAIYNTLKQQQLQETLYKMPRKGDWNIGFTILHVTLIYLYSVF